MPLSKLEKRNVYDIGQTQLYRNVDREDPQAILNGVAISGLVGILRQLGDLAEFAAEMFHGIQEEVLATASRSNQLNIRLQHIETAVPPLEKPMLAQTNHLHFAYTGGLEWHPRIPNEQNHLVYNELPPSIMDAYEECREPPRLHFLDKFDINGPGSCLKRYSDPTYFKTVSRNSIQGNKNFQKDIKNCKAKKKSSRSRDLSRLASMANQNARGTFTSLSFSGQTSSSKSASTFDMEKRFDLQDHHSFSFDSKSGSGFTECHSTTTSSLKTGEKPKGVFFSPSLTSGSCTVPSECESRNAYDNFKYSSSQGQEAHGSSCVSWDEKAELVESLGLQCAADGSPEMMETVSVANVLDDKASYGGGSGRVDFQSKDIVNAKSESELQQQSGIHAAREIKTGQEMEREPRDSEHETESEGDCFVDALNTIELESENDQALQNIQEMQRSSSVVTDERLEKLASKQEIEHSCNIVEDSCRSMDVKMDYGLRNDEKACARSDIHLDERLSCGFVERLPSVNASDEINHQDSRVDSDINRSSCNDLCVSKDNKSFTFVPALENTLSGSSNPLDHNGLQANQESEVEAASGNVKAIRIWTNGGLLGLEPLKPPVLAVPGPLNPDCKTEERAFALAEAVNDKSNGLAESSSLTTPGTQNLVSSDIKAALLVGERECHETSFGVFGLTHKLITNGFRKKDSFGHDRKTLPATIPENDEHQDFDEEILQDETLFDWFTSSPPLEHMKIYLNPADDTLQTSRLKLKFPNGDQFHGDNSYTTFSSFQLLPETATSFPDSFSDDDTFCRSSPCMSDTDYLGDNHSLSNSEQWEVSSDSHERKEEQKLYDSFHGSRHVENNTEDSSLPAQQIESETGCVDYLNLSAEPLPPPFPPIQWMVSKTTSQERCEDKTQSSKLQNTLKLAFEKHISSSTVNKEHKVKEDETEDFLHQIRKQQCNLRPVATTTTLSNAAAKMEPVINTKITAILEKANSIRQAVASNYEEESDTWSDDM